MLVVWQGHSHPGFKCHSPRIRSRMRGILAKHAGSLATLGCGVQEGAMS